MKIKRDSDRKKRELRNLVCRGGMYYYKVMVNGKVKNVSLGTDDLTLAKAKRDEKEKEALRGQLDKIHGVQSKKVGNLKEVCDKYEKFGGLTKKARRGNVTSILLLCRVAMGKPDLKAEDVSLDQLTPRLVRQYQDNLRSQYETEAKGEKEMRMARDRADRTSKSTFGQARSLFAKKRQLVDRYREAGIDVPNCVVEFAICGTAGKMSSKVYFPPSDAILRETFERVEELRESDCPELEACYKLFWAALATGCRRNELADMRVSDLVELNGRLWVGAGLGKDGKQIRIPVIEWDVRPGGDVGSGVTPAAVLRELLQEAKEAGREFLFDSHHTERHDLLPDRLNQWMVRVGWKDEKKLHALRAYIGCRIYSRNSRLAQLYLRHKSIATTEQFYSHFLSLEDAFELEQAAAAKPAAAPALTVVA